MIEQFLSACISKSGSIENLVTKLVEADKNTGLVLSIVAWQSSLEESKRVIFMPAQAVELLSYLTPRENRVAAMMEAATTLKELKEIAEVAGENRTEVVIDDTLGTKIKQDYLQDGSEELK